MKSFKFRLETLMNLRELEKERAVKDYANAISSREKAESNLKTAIDSLAFLNHENCEKKGNLDFLGLSKKILIHQFYRQKKELIIDRNSQLEEAKSIENAKEETFKC